MKISAIVVLALAQLAAAEELHALSHVLDEEGLLGGDADDVHLGELAVCAPHALARQSQPGARARVAVVHDELALLELDLRVVGGDALVVELDVRVLRLTQPHRVVVLQDGAVGRLVLRLLELELYDALVYFLSGRRGTFLMMITLNQTSQDSCTSCSSLSTSGFFSLMQTKVPVLLPRSRMQQDSSLKTICACLPLMDSSSGQLKSFSGLLPNLAPVRLNTLNQRIYSSQRIISQRDQDFCEEESAVSRSLLESSRPVSFLTRDTPLQRLKGQGMLEILIFCRGSRLSRLKGSLRADSIRMDMMDFSSALPLDALVLASDVLGVRLFEFSEAVVLPPSVSSPMDSRMDSCIDPLTDSITDPLTDSMIDPLTDSIITEPLTDPSMQDPTSDLTMLPLTDSTYSEFLKSACDPLTDVPNYEFLRGSPSSSPGSEVPNWELWKDLPAKLMSLNSMANQSMGLMSCPFSCYAFWQCWQQQMCRKIWDILLRSLRFSLEQQFLQVWFSCSLPMMQSRLKPSTPHFSTLSLYSIRCTLFSSLANCTLPSYITLMLFILSNSPISLVTTSSGMSISASSAAPRGTKSCWGFSRSRPSVSSRMALTTQNNLQKGMQLRSVMRQSRLALRYSTSKSLLPSISQLVMISRMLSSILRRLAKRSTWSTVQSILLCLISFISWHSLRMQGLSSSFCRMKVIYIEYPSQ